MPTLNDMLKDMPQHYNLYLRGVMNSVLPEFMDPFDSEINENNVSGELLEALRLVINDKYPDLKEGEVQSIDYDDVQKFFKESSIFEQSYEIGTVGEQIRTTLGEFGVRKIDGKINIFDTYDFEERDTFHAIKDVFNETRASGSIYPAARFMGGILMPEGPGGKPRPDALKVNITLPEQMQTVDIDYDDDIEPDAPTFVFEGPMTNKRASLWKKFTDMVITPAEAFVGGAAEEGTKAALEAELAMTQDKKRAEELQKQIQNFPTELPESNPFQGPRGPAGFARGVSTAITQRASEAAGVFTDKM